MGRRLRVPRRAYLFTAAISICLALITVKLASQTALAWVATCGLSVFAAVFIFLALQPDVLIYPGFLQHGKKRIYWDEIEQVDSTSWISPLLLTLKLVQGRTHTILFPGNVSLCLELLGTIRRRARRALLDGVPWEVYWQRNSWPARVPENLPRPRYRLLRPEDEAEVERLYQLLKTAGRLDATSSENEKSS